MKKRKCDIRKGLCVVLLCSVAAGSGFIVQSSGESSIAWAASSRKQLESLSVDYTGEAVMVGDVVSKKDITVVAYYDDGSSGEVRSFTLVSNRITREGDNTLTVTYKGLKETVVVPGKRVESIVADYIGEDVTTGQTIRKKHISVTAYFTDGSMEDVTDFTFSPSVANKEGANKVVVSYGGKRTEVEVYGKAPFAMEAIEADYIGEGVIVGNVPDKKDIQVTAYYNDGTSKELTSGYTMTPAKITKVGVNRVTVSVGSQKAEIEIDGLEKEVVSITASYIGGPLLVGARVQKENIHVTAYYNDGSKEVITDFSVISPVIYEVGANEIAVECGDAETTFTVRGVQNTVIDYGNAVTEIVGEEKDAARITAAVPYGYTKKDITVTALPKSEVEAAVQRAGNSKNYMAFEIKVSDKLERELPIAVKVEIPGSFEADRFAVYYTTNGKTITAKMNGEFIADDTYEFYIFEQGVYVFVDTLQDEEAADTEEKENDSEEEKKHVAVKSIEVVGLEKDKLFLRAGETYQLQITVLPKNASDRTLRYVSSRKKFVTVSETGLITGLQKGVSLVKIVAQDGSEVKKEILVYVE